MTAHTGRTDPIRTIGLLWRTNVKKGRSGLTLDAIVTTAVELADEVGVEGLSMRKLAERLGVSTMSLYAHVPGKAELIDLMIDHVNGTVHADPDDDREPTTEGWRARVEEIAARNWRMLTRHRWLLEVDESRPALGPGTIAKYDAELRPFADTGLDDVDIDQALALVLGHVRSTARSLLGLQATADETGRGEAEWWALAGPLLSTLLDEHRFPFAARIGRAAGEHHDAATDPRHAYDFGLRTILDGLEHRIARDTEPMDRKDS